jgi:hypothetical protein
LIGKSNFDEIFFEMQVINEAFRLAMFGIWELDSELLGMLEGAVISISACLTWKLTESYRFFGISRVRGLHLVCSME